MSQVLLSTPRCTNRDVAITGDVKKGIHIDLFNKLNTAHSRGLSSMSLRGGIPQNQSFAIGVAKLSNSVYSVILTGHFNFYATAEI
jgi:hypothetical protein